VIRGDATAAGISLGVIGLVVGVSSVGVWPKVAAAVLIGAGVWTVRWSRAAWRVLVGEVVQRFAHVDPGPSPVAWVSDAVWFKHNRFDPELDAMNELLAEVDALLPRFGEGPGLSFHTPVLRPVADNERELVAAGTPTEPVPPRGTGDALLADLTTTPGRQIGVGIRFPVCCGRLATLVSTSPQDRDPGAVFLSEHAGMDRSDLDPTRGLHGFLCRACGRRYATDPVW
jgi:hypothetical protein